jgi:hypothetical protein
MCSRSASARETAAEAGAAAIANAGHMYEGQETQVAEAIAKWADTLARPETGKRI